METIRKTASKVIGEVEGKMLEMRKERAKENELPFIMEDKIIEVVAKEDKVCERGRNNEDQLIR